MSFIEVIYKIPFSCRKNYIGESGRCCKTRFKEHLKDIEDMRQKVAEMSQVEASEFKPKKNVPRHVKECDCELIVENSELLFCDVRGEDARFVFEDWKTSKDKNCIDKRRSKSQLQNENI